MNKERNKKIVYANVICLSCASRISVSVAIAVKPFLSIHDAPTRMQLQIAAMKKHVASKQCMCLLGTGTRSNYLVKSISQKIVATSV